MSEEIVGLWWLPTRPDKQVAGTLVIADDRSVTLSLIGSLFDFNELQRTKKVPVIVGSGSGQMVTLLSSWPGSSQLTFPGTATSQFRPELTILGSHLDSADELRIVRAFAEFDYLFQWAGIRGIRQRFREFGESAITSLSYDYDKPPSIEVDIGTRKIGLHFGYKLSRPSDYEASIAESVSIEVEPPSPVSFDELLEQHVTPLQNFFTLAVGEYAQLRALRVILDRPEQAGERRRSVQLIFEPSFYTSEVARPVAPEGMLFTLSSVQDRLGEVLRRWFDQLDILRPVVSLYFATMANRRMYLEHRFLNLVQAVEIYHRRTNERTITTFEVFAGVRRSLCEIIDGASALDSTSRQMFKSKLAYLNEVPLKERLRELLIEHESALSLQGSEATDLARRIGDTRNFLTHYDRSLESRAARGIELLRLGDRVRLLMELSFLRDLGVSESERGTIARRRIRYELS